MMTTVFLSGSRVISRLNDKIRNRIKNIIGKGFRIIVGDANGADKALQRALFDCRYLNVIVFCSGQICRNNIGDWDVHQVPVDTKLRGRDFYTQKDKKMASEADYGFILWDGKSAGSFNNVLELLKRKKTALVYFAPEKEFYTISHLNNARELLKKCDKKAVESIQAKVKWKAAIEAVENSSQGILGL